MSKELANRIVALGVGSKHFGKYAHTRLSTIHDMTSSDKFVNDGRVMLALLNECERRGIDWVLALCHMTENACDERGESVGSAICEACCDALEANDEEGR